MNQNPTVLTYGATLQSEISVNHDLYGAPNGVRQSFPPAASLRLIFGRLDASLFDMAQFRLPIASREMAKTFREM